MAAGQGRRRNGVEAVHGDDRAAGGQRRHRPDQAEDPAERQETQQPGGRVGEAEAPSDIDGMGGDRTLRMQHQLGPAGGPRGGEDDAGRQRVGGVGERSPGRRRIAEGDDGLQLRQGTGADAGENGGEVDMPEARLQDQQLGARPAQQILDLGSPVAGVDGDQEGAQTTERQEDGEPFRAVGQPDRNPVARPHPLPRQSGGETAAEFVEGPVAGDRLAQQQRRRLGHAPQRRFEHPDDGRHQRPPCVAGGASLAGLRQSVQLSTRTRMNTDDHR